MRPTRPARARGRALARRGRRGGQVLPLAVAAIVALAFAILWLADLHHAIRVRNKTQDAGDAAALEAARWQAFTLNLAGELNAAAASVSAEMALARPGSERHAALSNSLAAIEGVSARLLFAGPLTGFSAAQQAARLNGAPDNDEFSDFLRRHANAIAARSPDGTGGVDDRGEEPWPGAWAAYSAALLRIAASGVAAGPDNAELYGNPEGDHVLLMPGFYLAVNGRDWCWFNRNAPNLPAIYADFRSWPPLPEKPTLDPPQNPEFLSVRLRLQALPVRGGPATRLLRYDPGKWGRWTAMSDPSFPISGDLRPESDYAGADVAMRVENPLAKVSDRSHVGSSVWTAAAKPFGSLDSGTGAKLPPTAGAFGVVTPDAFHDVGLVPLDAVLPSGGEAFDMAWNRHRMEHLGPYLERGTLHAETCAYCAILREWDTGTVKRRGIDVPLPREAAAWLSTNSWRCTVVPPGGGRGGGTAHAH